MTTKTTSTKCSNNPKQLSTSKADKMETYWTLTYEVNGDILVAKVINPETGKFRVMKHTLADYSSQGTSGYCPHAFLDRVQELDGKVISSETMHIITDFDFYCIDRDDMKEFIAALINYVTTTMFTYMHTKSDFYEFIKENRP